jgi:uncharacterized membrane protein
MLTLNHIYIVAGIFLLYTAWQGWRDRGNPKRMTTAAFWGLLAVAFLFGNVIPPVYMGALAIVIGLLAAGGGLATGSYPVISQQAREEKAALLKSRLFIPALMIPFFTLLGAIGLKHVTISGEALIGGESTTVISLGLACVIAFVFALNLTRVKIGDAIQSARCILDSIGWAAILPLLLAVLGGIFTKAGIGNVLAELLTQTLPLQYPWVAVLAYGLGMVAFTMIMGNAFAAFPVLTIGIALPVLVLQHGANPAPLAALGMLTGYCGTLLTPMAANYNIVPAALLELSDKNAVIHAQVMTALPLMACNIVLMYWLIFL